MKDSTKPPISPVVLERTTLEGYDQIWDAIPLYELIDFAVSQSQECSPKSQSEIRLCAESIVRANICHCCKSDENIVGAVTDEFVRHMSKGYQEQQAASLKLFKRGKENGNCTCSSWEGNETITIGIRTRAGQNDCAHEDKPL